MNHKPYSQACENNKAPILEVLQSYWQQPGRILEIGSGTGQHAVYFAAQLPCLLWQPSDLAVNHPAILAWMRDYPGENLLPPLQLDVDSTSWPQTDFDGVYTANTLHIMSWPQVLKMLDGISRCLRATGRLIVYGPFNYGGQFTSDSNRAFDGQLRRNAPHRAVRDFEAVCEAAGERGLQFVRDHEMPANNRCLVFARD